MLDENIRVMRREKRLTQEQLAEVMGVSTASVSKWETGVAVPELGMLAALADFHSPRSSWQLASSRCISNHFFPELSLDKAYFLWINSMQRWMYSLLRLWIYAV